MNGLNKEKLFKAHTEKIITLTDNEFGHVLFKLTIAKMTSNAFSHLSIGPLISISTKFILESKFVNFKFKIPQFFIQLNCFSLLFLLIHG